jgi:hypothetical protein
MTAVPELRLGSIGQKPLAEHFDIAEDDLLKHWIRAEGPERILAWAGEQEPSIVWENRYAHRCQACIRLYKDPDVRRVILDRHQDAMPGVIALEWLLRGMPNAECEAPKI